MSLTPGVRLGAYEILQLIGAGGMGEVYKARDTRLDRIVAVKVLPERFAGDRDRRERFDREARAVALLNHPHICDVHDAGETARPESTASSADSIHFLVMEYLEGQTLADRLVRGALSLPEMLRYAVEIADALDHAHRQGLVHRDLKPANVMLTATGTKLLDFGVSKLQPSPSVPALATVSSHDAQLTADGALLGTFPYMAPEQLEGREADVRSDIFAFGATVHEMATGQRAFKGETAATLIGAILHTDPPPLSTLQPFAPPALDRIVSRCLAKDPTDRWQTARDLMLELKAVSEHAAPSVRNRQRVRTLGLVASGALAVAAVAAAAVVFTGYRWLAPTDARMVRLAFAPPDGLTLADFAIGGPVTISPDGERVAFVATGRDGRQLIWVRRLESATAQPLTGSDGGAHPFWSPNGQFVGFFAQRTLKKIQLSGGPAQTLCEAILPRGGTWSKDGVIVFSAGAGRQLYRVSAAGSAATLLPGDGLNQERHWPYFLPDGRSFLYFGRPQKHGIYVDSIDSSNAKLLLSNYVGVAYSPPGYLLLLRGPSLGAPTGTVLAQKFDPTNLQIIGEPTPVADRIRYQSGLARGAFSVADNGTLVYGDIERSATQLTWFDRTGKLLGHVGGAVSYGQPSLSADQRTVAVERVEPGTQEQNIWLIDLTRNIPSRFTSLPNNITFMPVWSPHGDQVVFASARGGPPNLYQKASSGADGDELLFRSTSNDQPTDWAGDGALVVYASLDPKTQWDLWVLPMSVPKAKRKPVPFLRSEFNEHLGRLSPDGRWISYASDESGRNEVYVQTFPAPAAKRRISVAGGSEPRWRTDGGELFYLAPDGTLIAVPLKPGTSFEVGSPIVLFKARIGPTRNFGYDVSYTVSLDGQRFLIDTLTEESVAAPSTSVILNWAATLNRP